MGAYAKTPRVTIIRRAFDLSQEEFAAQFHIPIGTLRDWEQGRKEPDAAAKAYLRVIASGAGHGAQGPVAAASSQTVTPDCGAAQLEDGRVSAGVL